MEIMAQEEYDGTKCPYCGKGSVDTHKDPIIATRSVFCTCSCYGCGAVWIDQFKRVKFITLESK